MYNPCDTRTQIAFIPQTQTVVQNTPANLYLVPQQTEECVTQVPVCQVPVMGPQGSQGRRGKSGLGEYCRYTVSTGTQIFGGSTITAIVIWGKLDTCGNSNAKCNINYLKATTTMGGTLFTNTGYSALYLQVMSSVVLANATLTTGSANFVCSSIKLFGDSSCTNRRYGASSGFSCVNSSALIVLPSKSSFGIYLEALSTGTFPSVTISTDSYLQIIRQPNPS